MRSLYDALQIEAPVVEGKPYEAGGAAESVDYTTLSGKDFAQAVLDSPEFKRYITDKLRAGDLPPAITIRMMDYVWGKPANVVVHSGDENAPIVTEIRRVIVHSHQIEEPVFEKQVTH